MEFRILGPLEARRDAGAVALGGSRPKALLAVLLLHANESVSAERLAVALWGDDAPAGAVKTVQVHVSRLRKALGDADVVTTTPTGYRLVAGPDDLDVERFEREVAAARQALDAGRTERARDVLGDALALWRGAPLEDVAWAPFAPAEIGRLEELRLAAIELRVEADLALGRHAELVAELRRLAHEHPWRERLQGQLMTALYHCGRQADALAAYQETRRVFVEQLGIEPGAELRDLHQAMLRHDAALEAPPTAVRGASAPRGTLPPVPNATVGRARDIRAVGERLSEGDLRLLTLIGPGGVGKTRLALESAAAIEADFADGAHFVPLAAVERAQDVPAAIVGALGIVPLTGESPAHAVERFVGAKHLLIVLDNCEHLLAGAPFIGRLALAGRAVTVLATSREPLAVHAEQVYAVSPLVLPERGAITDLGALAGVAAVDLFCRRARAHDPGFALDAANAEAVAEICRRVDGLPLAIELAAARCGLLAPAEIAERLHGALGVLGAGPRDAPARQQTLRATIDWSHGLLSDEEAACFARFAVFAGGATVEAAETITGAGMDALDRLVAKSLLVRRPPATGPTRLRMLATIREYAAERFVAVADRESVRLRHQRYFLALARRHGSSAAVCGPRRREHLAALDAEFDNLHIALEWAIDQATAEPALALCAALGEYWHARNHYAYAVDWVERALGKPGAEHHPALRVRALCVKLWSLWFVGREDERPAVIAEAEAIVRTLDDSSLLAYVLLSRAAHEAFGGRFDAASATADEALACARAGGDPWHIALAAWARAMAATSAAELRERVEQAASLLEAAGNVFHRADLFHWAAYQALGIGSDRDAREFADQAIPLVRALETPASTMLLHAKLGHVALLGGDHEASARAFREQLRLAREFVMPAAVGDALAGLAAVAAAGNDLARSARLVGAASAQHHVADGDPVERRVEAAFFGPARARWGADAWNAAASEGAAMSIDEATAYAFAEARTRLD